MPEYTHDVVIIGGGSAGYAAAVTARDAGADVAIVDHGPLGGLCILRGCMPSKTILRSSDIMALMRRAPDFGLLPVDPVADLGAIMDRKERIVREFADYRIQQLHDASFSLYEHRGYFLGPERLQVGEDVLCASQFIIATGSVPTNVPIPGLDDVGFATSDDLLELRERPESMLVLGGGAVALELAQFFARIGTAVTLIQRSSHILSDGDKDLALPIENCLRKEGVQLFTGTQLHHFSEDGNEKIAHFSQRGTEHTAAGQLVFQALGRRPNIASMGIENTGINLYEGAIDVDDEMRTNQPHIFAIGDVNSMHEIVHIAIQQGEIAGYNATHTNEPPLHMDPRLRAQVTFTDPALASVGNSEKDCQTQDIPYLVASYPFDDHGKSITMGITDGHIKLLCEPQTGELLGAHIVGPEAGELIHELIAVMYFRGTVRDLLQIPHYHPTLSEIVTYPAEELVEKLSHI